MEFSHRSDGTYLLLEVTDRVKVPCKTILLESYPFDRCASCDCQPEELYRLLCLDMVCGPCYFADTTHICRRCRTRTEIKKVTKLQPVKNKGLDGLLLYCPVCEVPDSLIAMRAHILERHYEILEKLQQKQPGINQSQDNDGNFQHSHPATANDVSHETKEANRGFRVCPNCSEEWACEEIEAHAEECFKSHMERQETGKEAASRGHEKHVITCPEDQTQSEIHSRSHQSDKEGSDPCKCLEEEVRKLRDLIKRLEERIENLEAPLRRIITELKAKEKSYSRSTDV